MILNSHPKHIIELFNYLIIIDQFSPQARHKSSQAGDPPPSRSSQHPGLRFSDCQIFILSDCQIVRLSDCQIVSLRGCPKWASLLAGMESVKRCQRYHDDMGSGGRVTEI